MQLYVGNLSYNTTEDELKELFSQCGTPESVRILTDGGSGRSKGFGFVEFKDEGEARAAIATFNGKEIGGRAIVVNEAKPKSEGGSRGGGRGGGGGYGGGRGGYGGGRSRF